MLKEIEKITRIKIKEALVNPDPDGGQETSEADIKE
jgi:hypothetical protein